MADRIRVLQFGLGPIGIATAKLVLNKDCMELVGGVDKAEHLAGKSLAEILDAPSLAGATVDPDAGSALERLKPDVVLHTTSSFLPGVEAQLLSCVEAGAHVVSTTEELFYPFERDPEFCRRVDQAAEKANVVVVGTGVNPGFAMDLLPLTLTGICASVSSVRAVRVVDASKRREPLQRKVGAGMSEAKFRELVNAGKLGHIGLLESLQAVAAGLGWSPDHIDERIEPVLAEKPVTTPYFQVEAGQVAGIKHTCVATRAGKTIVDLDLRMYVGAEAPHDSAFIEGDPPVQMRIEGGLFGDTATVAALVNTAARVGEARPGLRTMLDLSVPRACS